MLPLFDISHKASEYMSIYTSKKRNWSLLLLVILIAISLPGYGQTITGTVFRDFNSDGAYTSIPASGTYAYGEPGVGGVIVTAYNAAGTAVASTTTTSSTLVTAVGDYTLTVGNTNAYRIEFTGLITGDYDGFRGTGSGTSVQFVNGGSANVNFGINYPIDYCQANPNVVVPCYVNGNSTGTGSGSAVAANRAVLVGLPYNSTGNSPTETMLALNSQIGTVYGVAYQREAKYIFTSAFLKRHSGLGSNGPGAIYLSKPSGTTYTHGLFITLPTAATAVTAAGSTTVGSNTDRSLPATAATPNHDPTIFDQVGKAGLGDLEISDDGTELYVVNLGDRKLYRIPIVNPTSASPTAGTPTSYTVPAPTQTAGSQFRPFGLKYYRNRVYVGGVTTNEAVSTTISFGIGSTSSTPLRTRDTTGMKAVVYEFNPATGTFASNPVLSFPLTYKKGASDNDQTGSSRAEYWLPWVDTQAPNSFLSRYARNDFPNASHPQPMLTDIEIDVDGSMIIGIRDRFGEQYGNQNYGTNTSDNSTLYRAIAPGDLLRAGKCDPSVNQWSIERNARVCNGPATAGAGNGQGIGGGEYYFSDAISQPSAANPYHAEMTLGGLALLPGYDEVMSTVMDPTTNTDAGGLRRFKMDGSGDPSTSVQIFYSGSDVSTYGKGNGLGDIELTCNIAPIEIGNRVWLDSNNNGIQDPGESPLAGVKVTLSGPGLTSPVSVTTNANGEYYFSSGSGVAATGFVYSLTGLTAGGSYTLTFPTSVTTNNSYLSSKPNSAAGANADNIDTDPNAAGIITFTLGQAGQNNFSYDAAYVPCTPPSLTAVASSVSVCIGASVTLTAQVSPAGSYTYAWSAPASVTLTGATTATATATGLPTGTTTFTVTVSTSPICSTTASVAVVVNPTPIASLSASQVTICAGQSTTLTASGGTSYRFSTTGTTSSTATAVVSPTVTTTYSVTVTNSSGCSSTATVTVTVNPLPVASLTASTGLSTVTICAGQSTTLTASGGTSYTFSTGLTNATGILVVSPATTTTYSVTVANASGCRSTTTATVTVNPVPTASMTSATICAGQSATLTATGGTSYSFSTGLSNATGLLVVSPTTTTTYSVTVANASGCRSTTTATVTVNPLPTPAMTSATICAGQSATLTATGGTSYSFSTGLTNTTGLLTVSPTTTTTYSVTVANANGCINTTTATVTVNPLPVAALSSATICAGQSATLTASGGTSYSFSTGLSNATGLLVVTPASTTIYSVTVATSAGCRATATGGVTVNNNPSASLSSATICVGQSVTLTATGGSSYSFSNGTTNTTGLLVVSPASTTTYSVTASSGAACSASATGTVTVNPLPVATMASATICAGQSATLTATGGTSYSFSTGLSNATGLLVVSPTTTTTYSVTVANASGCRSTTTATVTVNPLPTLSTTVTCNGIATFDVAFTVTAGASVSASIGTIVGNLVTGIPSGQTVTLTATLNGCSVSTQLTRNCQSNEASLGDFVWLDTNQNGIQDSGEPGIPDVTVILYINGVASQTTTTNASGLYSFTGLTPGSSNSYVVGFTAPAGYTATLQNQGADDTKDSDADVVTGLTQSVTLANGENNPTLDAGFYLIPASLGDFVFVDTNHNGIQDSGEPPISGVVVTLYTNGVASLTTITNASGLYSFTGLTPGSSLSYSVGFTTPSGYTATLANQGSDDTKDSDADVTTGRTQSVTLAPGENNPTLDAGFYLLTASLSLEKFVSLSQTTLGQTLTYTLVLTNTGTGPATSVVVRDSVSTGLRYVAGSASTPAGTTFTQGTPLSTWTVGSLSAGQSLSLTFQTIADSSGILYNKATIPGDTATACTSIPVKVCAGDQYTFTLTAPAGRSSYRWFRTYQGVSTELTSFTTNILQVSQPGSYSLAVDQVSGSCPDFSCCPFIIEEDTLPAFRAVAITGTCIGNTPQANGQIVLSGFNPAYTYQYSAGLTFNTAASLSGLAKPIPANGVIVSNLANPTGVQAYTVRVYNASGCYTDVTVQLQPTLCNCPTEICVPYVVSQIKRAPRIGDPR